MSAIIRTLPFTLSNLINKRRIKTPLRKLRCMILGLNKLTCVGHYNIVPICSDYNIDIKAHKIFKLSWDQTYLSIKNLLLNWKEQFWLEIINIQTFNIQGSICHFCQVGHVHNENEPGKAHIHNLQFKRPPFDAKNPFLAQIITNRQLHKGGARSCLHVEFDISNSEMEYEAGDYVAVYPKNDYQLVERLGILTNTDLCECFSLTDSDGQVYSYHTLLSHYLEITALPSKDTIMKLAQYCRNEEDRKKMLLMATNSEDGNVLYKSFVEDASRNIVHILEDIKSCRPPLDDICKLLPRLKPRYYSISSSPKLFPESVHVTAVVVKYKSKAGRVNQGVTTAWLAGHKPLEGEPLPQVPIYIRKSDFRLPINPQTPIIMVGTGTGLAPFRGFLQERAHARCSGEAVGDTILYFGCRHRHQDFIYQEELEEHEKCGLLKLNLAFSRDQAQKLYVTHLLEKNLQQLWDVLGNRNGHFYVCGNANNMAADVRNVVLRAIKEVGGKSDEDAVKFLNYLDTTKKYCSDVWS